MGKTIIITGGNSGIGLEVGRQLARQGHHVVLLGRDAAKGEAAAQGIRLAGGSVEFHAADLSTHAGCKASGEKLAAAFPKIDGIVHSAGVLTTGDLRTPDGLHAVFAVNYLSRYHLTQRLLPQLRAAGKATVVLIVAGVPLTTKIDFALFPKFDPFPGLRSLSPIQIANYHYAAHLAQTEPSLRAGLTNVGLVQTDILRIMPAPARIVFKVLGPLLTIPVARAAANPAWLTTHEDWASGSYWPKPGRLDVVEKLSFDAAVTAKVMESSRGLTGA